VEYTGKLPYVPSTPPFTPAAAIAAGTARIWWSEKLRKEQHWTTNCGTTSSNGLVGTQNRQSHGLRKHLRLCAKSVSSANIFREFSCLTEPGDAACMVP